ncbi:hypothetical protein WDZ17_14990 [Pseudokineococcus basanitobsidens]|uniref:Uncharacterized protein n=1 Tax=Pseudokineococcus basanitobsidens TaxID=1926649 RepID=A0ABU8RNB7_9ACTN
MKGSLRADHDIESRYVARSGRPTSVQRWTGSGWTQLTGARARAGQGGISLRVSAPAGAPIRLVTGDTAGTGGAVGSSLDRCPTRRAPLARSLPADGALLVVLPLVPRRDGQHASR